MPWNKQHQSLINTSMWIKLLGKIELWQYSSYTSKCIDIPGNTTKNKSKAGGLLLLWMILMLYTNFEKGGTILLAMLFRRYTGLSPRVDLSGRTSGRYLVLACKILFVIRLEYICSRSLEIRVTHRSSVNGLSFIVMEKHQTAICTELQPSTWKRCKKNTCLCESFVCWR